MTALTPQDADTLAGPEIKGRSLWADAWRRLIRNRAAVGGAIILCAHFWNLRAERKRGS